MTFKRKTIILMGIALILFQCAPKAVKPDLDSAVFQSRVIFSGQVVKLNATTLPAIQTAKPSMIVKVNKLYRGPKGLQGITGKNITVVYDKMEFRPDQKAIFFTNELAMGNSMVVSLYHCITGGDMTGDVEGRISAAVEAVPDRVLKERLAKAELVIVGTVKMTEPVQLDSAMDSEHNPEWHEAIIDIESVEKGEHQQSTVTVYFPASKDVAWYKSPKFKSGQEGIWILHRNQQKNIKFEQYTALDPMDFYPKEKLELIRKLLK